MAESIADFVATISAAGVESFVRTVGIAGNAVNQLNNAVNVAANANIAAFAKVNAAVGNVGPAAAQAGRVVAVAAGAMGGAIAKVIPSVSTLTNVVSMAGNSIKSVFVGATAAIYGFATAGIVGTVEGYRLSFAFGQMSRAIAGLFIPVMETAIKVMNSVRDYIHSLSDSQRDWILKWAGLAGGIALFNTGIGKIPGIILLVTEGFKLLSQATEKVKWLALALGVVGMVTGLAPLPGLLLAGTSALAIFGDTGMSAFDGIGLAIDKVVDKLISMKTPIVLLMGAVAGLLAAIGAIPMAIAVGASAVATGVALDSLEGWRNNGGTAQGGADRGFGKDTHQMTGGFEDVGATYKRIAQITMGQKDPVKLAEDQLAEQKKAVEELKMLVSLIPGLRNITAAPQLIGLGS